MKCNTGLNWVKFLFSLRQKKHNLEKNCPYEPESSNLNSNMHLLNSCQGDHNTPILWRPLPPFSNFLQYNIWHAFHFNEQCYMQIFSTSLEQCSLITKQKKNSLRDISWYNLQRTVSSHILSYLPSLSIDTMLGYTYVATKWYLLKRLVYFKKKTWNF